MRALPFAVGAVEEKDAVAGAEAQHVEEVVGLVAVGLDDRARRKRRADEKTLGGEVVAGHGAGLGRSADLGKWSYPSGEAVPPHPARLTRFAPKARGPLEGRRSERSEADRGGLDVR